MSSIQWHCPSCARPMRSSGESDLWCPRCNIELEFGEYVTSFALWPDVPYSGQSRTLTHYVPIGAWRLDENGEAEFMPEAFTSPVYTHRLAEVQTALERNLPEDWFYFGSILDLSALGEIFDAGIQLTPLQMPVALLIAAFLSVLKLYDEVSDNDIQQGVRLSEYIREVTAK